MNTNHTVIVFSNLLELSQLDTRGSSVQLEKLDDKNKARAFSASNARCETVLRSPKQVSSYALELARSMCA